MLKIFAAIAILAAATLTGFYFSEKLKKRRIFLRDFIGFLSLLKTMMRYDGSEIKSLISRCGDAPTLEIFRSEIIEPGPIPKLWEKAAAGCREEFSLTAEDLAVINDFGNGLGSSDIQGQIEHIELYEILIRKRLDDAEQNFAKNSRLYKMLGFFAGTVAAIMII